MAGDTLLFVDTNIWLDFYRARNDAGLKLLMNLDGVSDKIIVTHQLEMEFQKNRHAAILEGLSELKSPQKISRPAMFSNMSAVKRIDESIKRAEANVTKLRSKYSQLLEKPNQYDPVYQVTRRIFGKDDPLCLQIQNEEANKIVLEKAEKRFYRGCPPRKKNDNSYGDAINWEWMIQCAIDLDASVVIVSRDQDYGINMSGNDYLNDHLLKEFKDRVGGRKKVSLYSRLSEALKLFEVKVSKEEIQAEDSIIHDATSFAKLSIEVNSGKESLNTVVQMDKAVVKPTIESDILGQSIFQKPDLSPPKEIRFEKPDTSGSEE